MNPSLASQLIPRLEAAFADRDMHVLPGGSPCAVFKAIHPEVGDVEIHDDKDELTVCIGRFTHSHISNHDEGIDDAERGKRIAESLIEFLGELFEDRIELYGNARGGGVRKRERGAARSDFTGLFRRRVVCLVGTVGERTLTRPSEKRHD